MKFFKRVGNLAGKAVNAVGNIPTKGNSMLKDLKDGFQETRKKPEQPKGQKQEPEEED